VEEFKSTAGFVEQLVSGKYPRPVLENDEDEIDFDEVTRNFKALTSQPGHYDYLLNVREGD
jgi:hypothetical protein